jgi:hypothetical protein
MPSNYFVAMFHLEEKLTYSGILRINKKEVRVEFRSEIINYYVNLFVDPNSSTLPVNM